MKPFLERSHHFLEIPLDRGPRGLLVVAALLLAFAYLTAALEPDDVRAAVPGRAAARRSTATSSTGGNDGQDIKEINVLNHYIGMHDLATADFTEFKWIPFVVGGLGLLFLRAAVLGKMAHARRRLRALPLLRPLLALVVRIQALRLRAQPRADSVRQGRPVHAADLRLQEARELRGVLVPALPAPTRSPASRSCFVVALVLAWRERARCSEADGRDDRAALSRRSRRSPAACRRSRRRGSTGRPPAARRVGAPGARGRARQTGATVEVAARTLSRATSSSTAPSISSDGAGRCSSGSGQLAASCAFARADVTIEGFDIDGGGGRRPRPRTRPASTSPRRASPSATAASRGTLFGVYLREADGATVERLPDSRHPGQGSRARRARASTSGTRTASRSTDNAIADVRDGFYIQSSSHGLVTRQHGARSALRPALHVLRRQPLRGQPVRERGAAGTALMYSKRIVFRRNRFLHNRGFASVGLLLKACDDVLAEDNLIADNARGIFLEGSYRQRLPAERRRRVRHGDRALRLLRRATASRATRSSPT